METKLANAINLIEYLREHYKRVGLKKYSQSFVSLEHGVGTGFGGVGNTGSGDCLKEQIRALGTRLGAKFTHVNRIYFQTQKGLSITQQTRTKHNFRVEHTLELVDDLYPEMEKKFIFSSKKPAPQGILDWVIENHICVGIHPSEQKSKRTHGASAHDYKLNNYQYPFKKYSTPVYYQGQNVSHLTRSQIAQINRQQHSGLKLDVIKLKKALVKTHQKLHTLDFKGHRLCPQLLAEQYYDDCNSLLYHHYRYKFLAKVGNPSSSWYDRIVANDFRKWEKLNGLKPI